MNTRELFQAVIVGHVDHGKSTIIGRLLADTNSLPLGKLEQVRQTCEKNSKPFEYAFLLDALKDEQAQGITIDSARVFFKTELRDYLVMDAPGHVEFIKNMVTGASRAEAAFIVVDAEEGIQENSKRHGFLVSILGIKQVIVLINKMDLENYSEKRYQQLKDEYEAFLKEFNIEPLEFIPLSAMEGENVTTLSDKMPWFKGQTVLDSLESLKKVEEPSHLPSRFPVQDIYKFTKNNDKRRILAGTIESGSVKVGDRVTLYPYHRKSTVKSIEEFNRDTRKSAKTGEAIGITLDDEFYIQPGEILAVDGQSPPKVGSIFKANLFWLGVAPFEVGKRYKLKLGTSKVPVVLRKIITVLDKVHFHDHEDRDRIDRHEIAEVLLETTKPIAFDLIKHIEGTGRFVIVDELDIAGGGVILEQLNSTELKSYLGLPLDEDKDCLEESSKEGLGDGKVKSGLVVESHLRSFAKAISWRFIALITTALIAWKYTGFFFAGMVIGLSDSVVKLVLYYAHERIWEKVNFGRKLKNIYEEGGGI